MEQLQLFNLRGMTKQQLFSERAKAVELADNAKARADFARWKAYLHRQEEINKILTAKKGAENGA